MDEPVQGQLQLGASQKYQTELTVPISAVRKVFNADDLMMNHDGYNSLDVERHAVGQYACLVGNMMQLERRDVSNIQARVVRLCRYVTRTPMDKTFAGVFERFL